MTVEACNYSEQIIAEQLGLYASQMRLIQEQFVNPEPSVSHNSSPQQHNEQAVAMELKAVIGLGLTVYDAIHEADIRWSESSRDGQTKESDNDAKRIESWHTEWLTTSETVLTAVVVLEKAGFPVANSLKLRDACAAIRTGLSISPDRVARAVESLSAGRFKSMEAVRGELRRKMVTGS